MKVWPIARERINWLANTDYAALRARAGPENPLRRRAGRAAGIAGNLSRYVSASVRDRRHNASLREQADLLVMGDNVSRIQLAGEWYDRFCAPFTDLAVEL